MASSKHSVAVRCPSCSKEYRRLFKEHEDGYGYCKDCNTKVVKVSDLKEERRLAAKRDRINAELQGIKYVRTNNSISSCST